MKKIFLITILLFTTFSYGQTPERNRNGIKFNDVTEVTTASRIAVFDTSDILNYWISMDSLVSIISDEIGSGGGSSFTYITESGAPVTSNLEINLGDTTFFNIDESTGYITISASDLAITSPNSPNNSNYTGYLRFSNLTDNRLYSFANNSGYIPMKISDGTTELGADSDGIIDISSLSLGGGSTPTLQQVTTQGATTTDDVTIEGSLTVGSFSNGATINLDDGSGSYIEANDEMQIYHPNAVILNSTTSINLVAPSILKNGLEIISNGIEWNASTNTPILSNTDVSVTGVIRKISTTGTQDLGNGSQTYNAGDYLINDGSEWVVFVDNNQSISSTGNMNTTDYDPLGKQSQVLTVTDLDDDDTFASASSLRLASSESIKAYVDANSGANILPLDNTFTGENTFEGEVTIGDGGGASISFDVGDTSNIYVEDGLIEINNPNEIALIAPNVRILSDNGLQHVNAFAGAFDASTNTENLSNTNTHSTGVEYVVTVAGTQDFGAGNITLGVGDIIANDGTIWYKKVDNNQSGGSGGLGGTIGDEQIAFGNSSGEIRGTDEFKLEGTALARELHIYGKIIAGNTTTGANSSFSLRDSGGSARTFATYSASNTLKIGGGYWENVLFQTGAGNEHGFTEDAFGVNTDTPSEALEVIGDAQVDAIILTGGAPTLDNSESAMWTATASGTKDSVSYDEGDVLVTSKNSSGTSKTKIILDFSAI